METETVTVSEAARLLGVNPSWIYVMIKNGTLRVAERGRGRGRQTMLLRQDVEAEKARRLDALAEKMRGMEGGN